MARVLVVDDEEKIRTAVRRILAYHQHEVVAAADGDEAMRLFQEGHYDVALVDYMMNPGPFGDVVLRHMLAADRWCARVLMTAIDDPRVVTDGINNSQISQFLRKPFNEESLVGIVTRALDNTQAARAAQREITEARRDWRECVDEQLLRLDIQPIVQATWPHGIMAVECLIRSRHPRLSRPDLLLEAVEKADKVFEFGAVVNRLAADWADRVPPEVLLFVNVHPDQFGDPDLMATFAPLQAHAHRVVLEITERVDVHKTEKWEEKIAALSRAGFQLAIDDLGAGHSGLTLLAELQPSFIKIDMSIIRGVHQTQRKQRLVELITKFANASGERVVGEGVETAEEAQTLLRCGVHLLQGYLYGRPGPSWPVPAP